MTRARSWLLAATCVALLPLTSLAQTTSSCNPLTQGGCPADPALGGSKSITFTSADTSDFSTSGGTVQYGSNGAQFTIAQSGDSPTITSKWYIMFGHVEYNLQAAPGTGIVSSAILQSDDLDEIDWEWLGGDDTQVQSNYFGKGQTVTGYNRGAFHNAPNNHDSFNTYSVDWTSEQIIWSINGQTVRVLTQEDADGQYPQTPMQVKVGIWAGGDPANAPGTIEWAGGLVNYAGGPYTMYLKSMSVTDYSTGSSYSYDGTSGTWQSIVSNGGTVFGGSTGEKSPAVSGAPSVTTATGAPVPLTTNAAESSILATRTGYPWSGSTDVSVSATLPSTSSPSSASSVAASSASAFEQSTAYNQPSSTYTPASATGLPNYMPSSAVTIGGSAAASTFLISTTSTSTTSGLNDPSILAATRHNGGSSNKGSRMFSVTFVAFVLLCLL